MISHKNVYLLGNYFVDGIQVDFSCLQFYVADFQKKIFL